MTWNIIVFILIAYAVMSVICLVFISKGTGQTGKEQARDDDEQIKFLRAYEEARKEKEKGK